MIHALIAAEKTLKPKLDLREKNVDFLFISEDKNCLTETPLFIWLAKSLRFH